GENRQSVAAPMIAGGCRQHRRGIGADRGEAGDAHVEQATLPPLQIEAEAHQAIGQRRRHEEGEIADDVDRVHASARPNRPAGRTSSTAISSRKAIAARYSAPTNWTAMDSAMPTMRPPSTAPGTLPMPPRIAAANIGSSRSKPMNGRIC